MKKSTLTTNQKHNYYSKTLPNGNTLIPEIRFDDECNNGHNTFAITATEKTPRGKTLSCGCLHEEISKLFPELAQYLKWHLCATDGPLHYIANTIYHAENSNLSAARNSAIWPDATLEDLQDEAKLKKRLPKLLDEFRLAMESLGFTW